MGNVAINNAARGLIRALGPYAHAGALSMAQRFALRAQSREELIWRDIAAAVQKQMQLRITIDGKGVPNSSSKK